MLDSIQGCLSKPTSILAPTAIHRGPAETKQVSADYAAVSKAAEDAGRPTPRLMTSRYFALGDLASAEQMRSYLQIGGSDAYASLRPNLLTDPNQIRRVTDEHRSVGSDELCLWAQIGELDQIDRLAEVVFS